MKNFLRALKYSWPYRGRLIMSFVCAFMAAIFWSLSLASITPTLDIMLSGKNLQTSVGEKINKLEDETAQTSKRIDEVNREYKQWEGRDDNDADKQRRDRSLELAKLEDRQASATRELWLYQKAKVYLQYAPTGAFATLAWVFGSLVVAFALKGFFDFWQDTLVGSVINLSIFDMRKRFYRKVIHFDVGQFSEQGSSELMARFTNDMELLANGTKTLFGKMVAEPLRAVGCVIAACYISWQLTLMFLVLVPVALYILHRAGRAMKRATRRLLERMSNIYKILQETFQGIRVVKAFTMEPRERRRFGNATRDYYEKAMLVVKIDALAGPLIELLGVAAVASALLAGAYLVINGETHLFRIRMVDRPMIAASLLQLYAFLAAISDPVRKLSSVYTKLQSGGAAADRIFAFMDREPRVHANCESPRLDRHGEYIEFRGICFSYEPGRPVLTNVNLDIRFGETVALVGRNGSGKTTLLGLVPCFFDPDHGSIVIDGHNIRDINLRSLRQQVGLVTQDTILFDDTILNNIGYGCRRALREEIEIAAKKAFAHDFIERLEHGYDTRVGEAGSKLSGGQKQRIALARAILRNPRILILDEFTSQYDAESERLIHSALKEFMRGRTTFVITHRLNTLEVANRIVVLDAGHVAAVGSHAELLATCPAYQRLHEAQFQKMVA